MKFGYTNMYHVATSLAVVEEYAKPRACPISFDCMSDFRLDVPGGVTVGKAQVCLPADTSFLLDCCINLDSCGHIQAGNFESSADYFQR